jgi:hypothetical protein
MMLVTLKPLPTGLTDFSADHPRVCNFHSVCMHVRPIALMRATITPSAYRLATEIEFSKKPALMNILNAIQPEKSLGCDFDEKLW